MNDTKIRRLVLSAMFAALTMSVKVPSLTKGYVNIGDSIVLLSAWLIGGAYGALAAGIGSAMADLLSGYSHYVPGTLVIKFLMALFAWLVFTALVKRKAPKTAAYIVSAGSDDDPRVFYISVYDPGLRHRRGSIGQRKYHAGNHLQPDRDRTYERFERSKSTDKVFCGTTLIK